MHRVSRRNSRFMSPNGRCLLKLAPALASHRRGERACMSAIERLHEIEEIRQVKHRYLRCVDLKLWDEIGDTLTESATLDTGTSAFGKLGEITGRAEIVAFFRARLGSAMLTGHTATQPEITVDGDDATGVWAHHEMVLATK